VASTGLRIELLGGFRVRVGDRAVADDAWRRRKPAALIKLLALAPGHRLHREQVMDALWSELGSTAAGANLRKVLYYARSALEDATSGGAALISSDGDVVALAAAELSTDVELFRSSLAGARRAGDVDEYSRAVLLYRGELLPDDRYDDWAVGVRRELHVEFLAALTELAALLEARGELERAIEIAQQLVAAESTREESHATLIRLYALAGRRSDALQQYEHVVRLLDEELGTEPGPETQRLYEEIRARRIDEPELTADLWERVGDLRVRSGDAAGAAKAFARAIDAAAGAATARVERKCAEAWLMQHRPDMADPHLAAAEEAATDPVERARLLRARANHAWESGDIERAQRFAEQAMDAARRDGTVDDLAAAHEAAAIVSHFKGEWRDGLASELERLASDDAGLQLARVYDIHHCIGQYHLYGDGLADSVEDYARRMLDRAEDVGAVRAQAFAWCLLGETLLLQARWDESEGCLARSCDLHGSLGSRSGALAWQRRAELAACRGAYDDVNVCLQQAAAIATVSAMASHVWGRIHATRALAAVEQANTEEAIRSVQAAAASAARYGDCPTCSALLNPVAAEAFAMVADPDSARTYADAAGRVAQMFTSSAWQAMADTASGSAALAEGDASAARGHFVSARDQYGRAGQPYWAQRAHRLASVGPA
jgi:DNA-binding SARP family transcriptional activator